MITLSFIRSGHWISDIRPGVEERYLNTDGIKEISSRAPVLTGMQVIPVAGRDSMLLNLSGAHGPFFTRNIVILEDSAGNTGIGEVPGGWSWAVRSGPITTFSIPCEALSPTGMPVGADSRPSTCARRSMP